MCDTFYHNFRYIPLCKMSYVSLEMHYFVLYDSAITLKMSKMAFSSFCNETLHIFAY